MAVVVEHLLGAREVVVKNLGSHLRRVHGISGATVLGDGQVVLIVNPDDLPRPPRRAQGGPARVVLPRPAAPERVLTVLVVDDSPSVRRVVAKLLRDLGWQVIPARDGLEALELLHQSASPPSEFQ